MSQSPPHRRRPQAFVARLGPAVIASILAASAAAEPAATPPTDSAALQERLREQERRLSERDALIEQLVQRVDRLEQRLAAAPPGTPAAPAAGPGFAPNARLAEGGLPASPAPGSTSAPAPRGGPGSFDVDPASAERALERTLVQTGALLLPYRKADLEPSFSFTRNEQTVPAFARIGDALVLANQEVRRNESRARLDLRLGLPYETQLELGLPYQYVQQDRVLDLGAAGRLRDEHTGSGVGDLSVGLAKTLLREQGWRPDLIARLTYGAGTGSRDDGGVALDGGFPLVRAELVALTRQDPLAFVLNGFYQVSWEDQGVRPGDLWGLGFAAVLAASPDTSLRFGFSQAFRDSTRVRDTEIPGSDQTVGMLELGLSSILGPGVMLNGSLGVGLSENAPDYQFRLAVPVRFDL